MQATDHLHLHTDHLPFIVASGSGGVTASATHLPAAISPTRQLTPPKKTGQKGRLLWIGDAVVPTGFATVTHSILDHLHKAWNVTVSGVNYSGKSHRHPYRILPAWQGGDMWGMDRFADLCAEFAPDVVVINNDWWNVAKFLDAAPAHVPIIGYMPVDGSHLDSQFIRPLNRLAAAVWYTDFGHQEAVNAGFTGSRHVIPHGMDTQAFHPVPRHEARRLLHLPEKAFIVGNVNRNQPRKRLDVTIQIFAKWVKTHHVNDARLLLHCARKDIGWDLEHVARIYGVEDRLIFTGEASLERPVSMETLRLIYSSLDVQMTTTLGEGWGLTTMEGLACGVPQIVPQWSALAEWCTPAMQIPCSMQLVHPEVNTVGALPDPDKFVTALDTLYRDSGLRQTMSSRGVTHVRQRAFKWSQVAKQMEEVMQQAIASRHPSSVLAAVTA